MPKLIKALQNKGYRFVSVEEALGVENGMTPSAVFKVLHILHIQNISKRAAPLNNFIQFKIYSIKIQKSKIIIH